ncbi:putative leader peptide [Marinitenerispora sediminis]|nr:putative leader peptide [Marinitenerispora sediminis]
MTVITYGSAPGVRLAGRRHVDLLRVASALCHG